MSKAIVTESGKVGFIIGSGDASLEYTKADGTVDKTIEVTQKEAHLIANMKNRTNRLLRARRLAKKGYTKV